MIDQINAHGEQFDVVEQRMKDLEDRVRLTGNHLGAMLEIARGQLSTQRSQIFRLEGTVKNLTRVVSKVCKDLDIGSEEIARELINQPDEDYNGWPLTRDNRVANAREFLDLMEMEHGNLDFDSV